MSNEQDTPAVRHVDTPSGRIGYVEVGSGPVALLRARRAAEQAHVALPARRAFRFSALHRGRPACARQTRKSQPLRTFL